MTTPTAGFFTFMQACLPASTSGGKVPHITSGYVKRDLTHADRAAGGYHRAIDMNYVAGQAANPPGKYPVFSPVAGTVARGRSCNSVNITDNAGYIHGFLHMSNIQVGHGSTVHGGQHIGYMDGVGAGGVVHLHYQLIKISLIASSGPLVRGLIDPNVFWGDQKQVFIPGDSSSLNLAMATDPYHNQRTEGSTHDEAGYMPRHAATSGESFAGPALWTNRVPTREPWGRVMMVDTPNLNDVTDETESNTSHNPQFTNEDEKGKDLIGRVDGDITYTRGPFWRR